MSRTVCDWLLPTPTFPKLTVEGVKLSCPAVVVAADGLPFMLWQPSMAANSANINSEYRESKCFNRNL